MIGSTTVLDSGLTDELEGILGAPIDSIVLVSGGDIATAFRITSGRTNGLLKLTPAVSHSMVAELDGLNRLATVKGVWVPAILGSGIRAKQAFLLLEWIETSEPTKDFWSALAQMLAKSHAATNPLFGLNRDNLIGLIQQENGEDEHWADFFAARRLEPQIRLARDSAYWLEAWTGPFKRLLGQIDSIIPANPVPGLLHGDLWRGNVLCGEGGRPYLIDPAVYYGHYEVDLAFSEMFGGFDRRFYEAYAELRPIEAGYAERRTLYNLYHYLNHLNHFGPAYQSGVTQSLERLK